MPGFTGKHLKPASHRGPWSAAPGGHHLLRLPSGWGMTSHDGLSEGSRSPRSVKVNGLDLQPGDRVLFKCGDTWRGEQLVLSQSGTAAAPITFSSYPAGCANQPVLSGSRPITGWTLIPAASTGLTSPSAVVPHGHQPALPGRSAPDAGALAQPGCRQTAATPSWTATARAATRSRITSCRPSIGAGRIVHIKNIRWSMLDRQVTSSSGHTLTLNQGLSCLVSGWAHLRRLGVLHQQSPEHPGSGRRVVLRRGGPPGLSVLAQPGSPANIEGSVILEEADTLRHGGIMLSDGSATAYVTIDNMAIKNWFNHGIGTPGGMSGDIYHDITVQQRDHPRRGCRRRQPEQLARSALRTAGKGLRGGYHMTFFNNIIDGANHFGITRLFCRIRPSKAIRSRTSP